MHFKELTFHVKTVLVVVGAYEPLKAEKERPTTHQNHLTHLPKKERDVYLARKLQR